MKIIETFFDQVDKLRYSLYGISTQTMIIIDIISLLLVFITVLFIIYRVRSSRGNMIIRRFLIGVDVFTVAWISLYAMRVGVHYFKYAMVPLIPLALFNLIVFLHMSNKFNSSITKALLSIIGILALEFYTFYFLLGEVVVIHGLVNFA